MRFMIDLLIKPVNKTSQINKKTSQINDKEPDNKFTDNMTFVIDSFYNLLIKYQGPIKK